jgi:benzaldehyde dehydrogenase (NAD)
MSLLDSAEWTGKIRLGQWSAPTGGETAVIEPATGAELGRIGLASPEDVARASDLAARRQPEWAATSFQERAAVLRRAGDAFLEHAEEIKDWLVREAGSIPGKADVEVRVAAQECYEAAALASSPAGEVLRTDQPRLSMVRRVPAGVVGVISPFNVPLILSIRSVAPALALGNTVLLKPDPRTAVCGGAVLAEIFAAAGLPEGVLQVLPGRADAGQALVTDRHVRIVSFTGSTAAGRAVGTLAAEHFKRVHLELGGNSALIVLPDADLDAVISTAAWGSFFHQGQICMSSGRHLVHERIVDEYVERLAAKAESLPVGNPATGEVALGPIIDTAQRDRVHGLVTTSTAKGAKLVAGGTYEDLFYRPTVLTGVGDDTPAYGQEVFGPVAPVRAVASEQEAVALAADSEYGLSVGIVTSDVMRGLELAERIPTGLVHINDQTVNDEAVSPFGGVLASGNGARLGGRASIDAFTDTRWITARGSVAQYPF